MKVPRPENEVRPSTLDSPLFANWIAQYKMNGQYLVVSINQGQLSYVDRRNVRPKNWTMRKEDREQWMRLLPDGIYCCELLNSKVSGGPKHTFYLHDVLLFQGTSMVGASYHERYQLLFDNIDPTAYNEVEGALEVSTNFWIALNYKRSEISFVSLFNNQTKPWHEGIVLKNPEAKLTATNPQGWCVKCRHPTANYPH